MGQPYMVVYMALNQVMEQFLVAQQRVTFQFYITLVGHQTINHPFRHLEMEEIHTVP